MTEEAAASLPIGEPQPGKITEPGIYEMPFEAYLDDPCAEPSLNSHGAREILDHCPAVYWWNSPLNPERPEQKVKKHFDIGHAAHEINLHGAAAFKRRVHVLSEDCNLQTKAGREERDEAMASGLIVLKHDEGNAVRAMRKALNAHEFAANAFKNGRAEPVLACQDPETGVWLRCRPDWLPTVPRHVPDYKTALSARPEDFQRAVANYGYHMQAAFYIDVIALVTGEQPQSFYFVVQEKTPPYLITCMALDAEDIAWGRIQNRKAIHTFARCLEADRWPGYAEDVVPVSLPGWRDAQLQRDHERGKFDVGEVA